jgi:hypothetical protein
MGSMGAFKGIAVQVGAVRDSRRYFMHRKCLSVLSKAFHGNLSDCSEKPQFKQFR